METLMKHRFALVLTLGVALLVGLLAVNEGLLARLEVGR